MDKQTQIDNIDNIIPLFDSEEFISLFGYQSDNKVKLMLITMMQESRFFYRYQMGNGPARGFGQVETATAIDNFKNYLEYRNDKLNIVLSVLPYDFDYYDFDLLSEELANNDLFNLIMARLVYYRVKESVPTTIDGMASYWKRYYNTAGGKGKTSEFIHSSELLKDFL